MAFCQFGGLLDTFGPQKLLRFLLTVPLREIGSQKLLRLLLTVPSRETWVVHLSSCATIDWSGPGCHMIEWLCRAGARWLFAPRGRVVRHLLPTEAPIIDKAVLHLTHIFATCRGYTSARRLLDVFFFR